MKDRKRPTTTSLSLCWRALLLLSCIASSVLTTSGKQHIVQMFDAPPYFNPSTVEVMVGDTVIWKNTGPSMAHVVMDENQLMFSDDINVGRDWSRTFAKAGLYRYICYRH